MVDAIEYVLGFAFIDSAIPDEAPEVVLIEKLKPDWQRGKYNGVGGKIEKEDLDPSHAMVREFYEETDVKTNPWDWYKTISYFGDGYIIHGFSAHMPTSVRAEVKSKTDERVIMVSMHALPGLYKSGKVIYNLSWLIPMSLDQNLWGRPHATVYGA